MLRRIIALSLIAYAVASFLKGRAKRAADSHKDSLAHADWESEGGSPAPEPVDGIVPA